jgi:hypothetical protein
MRKPNVMWSVIVFLFSASLAMSAPPGSPANVGQVDVFGLTLESGWQCPNNPGVFQAVPGMALSLSTSGGPIMYIVNFNFHGSGTSPGSGFQFHPVIDGTPFDQDRLGWQTGLDSEVDTFAYTRVYAVPPGSHVFSAEMACQSDLIVFRGWMTVYELPSVKR